VIGLWAGLLAGLAAGAAGILGNGYLGEGLTLNAVKTSAAALARAVLAAVLLVPAAGAIWSLLHRLRGAARLALYLLVMVALFVIGDGLDLEDTWWVAEWEVWTAATLVLLLPLRHRWPRPPIWAGAVPLAILAALHMAEARMVSARIAQPAGRPNIVLLLVDALRPDHMSVYGYDRPTTPTMGRLAARGVLFARAVSPSNKTRTTMPSLWTGLYPSRHGMFTLRDRLPARHTTAAERLREAGYRTAAFCPNPNLDRSVGHAQGWDRYDDRGLRPERFEGPPWQRYETAAKIHERVLQWIDRDPDRPFLAWLHYRDVHGPYVPPPPYDTLFTSGSPRSLTPEERAGRNKYLNLENDGNDLNTYIDRYDGEIRYTDERISEFLEALEARGLAGRTVLILTADHGEAFLDHGLWNHGDTLHEEQIHVPLIIAGPGVAPRVEGQVVSTLDIFATMLDLAGLPIPRNDGASLVPILAGGAPRGGSGRAFAEGISREENRQWAVREGDWKLVLDDQAGKLELFNLAADPGERRDRLAEEPEVTERLLAELEAFVERVGGDLLPRAEEAEVDEELMRRLESLGYVD
jgi:arylsulfatase